MFQLSAIICFLVFFLCAPIILHDIQFDIHACSLLCIQICFLKRVNCVYVQEMCTLGYQMGGYAELSVMKSWRKSPCFVKDTFAVSDFETE